MSQLVHADARMVVEVTMPTRPRLTFRRRALLHAIPELTTAQGFPPNIRELAEHLGLSSPSSVAFALKPMIEAGWVSHVPLCPRTLAVTDAGRDALVAEPLIPAEPSWYELWKAEQANGAS